jgi:acyl carrier protein
VSAHNKDFIWKHFPLARTRKIIDADPLLENGILDSLGILEVVTFIEHEFHIVLNDDDLIPENFRSIEYIAAFVQEDVTILQHIKIIKSPKFRTLYRQGVRRKKYGFFDPSYVAHKCHAIS